MTCKLHILISSDIPPLMVTASGGPLSVGVGQSQSLFCQIEGGGSNVSVRWLFNNVELQSGVETSIKESYLFSQFHINSVSVVDAGDYVCDAYSPELDAHIDASITIIVLGMSSVVAVRDIHIINSLISISSRASPGPSIECLV